MTKNVLQWLEKTAETAGGNIAYSDEQQELTFEELLFTAKKIGSGLLGVCDGSFKRTPVVVISRKSVRIPAAYLGVVYSGYPYAPVDGKLPRQRILRILQTVRPGAILADTADLELAAELVRELAQELAAGQAEEYEQIEENRHIPVLELQELAQGLIDETGLAAVRRGMVSTDPLYILFTSGSSGTPKGVATSHQSLMYYIEAYGDMMQINDRDCLGNQSPLDYIAAIRDIYLPLARGCHTHLIPKEYYMEPEQLFTCMRQQQVTTVGWSVSAFTILHALGALEDCELPSLKKVCFSGSVMPGKVLRSWQECLPQVDFVNQYGPTEATASCTYYRVDHRVEPEEILPVGSAYENYEVFLLDEQLQPVEQGQEGEIFIGGPCVALGYYRDPERTAGSFLQNPLHRDYAQRVYRTGDIGAFRADGMLEFHGRRDRQIKHMGHRVELDEVEAAGRQVSGVEECSCLYNQQKEVLWFFYQGTATVRELSLRLRDLLPGYMIPRKIRQLEELPKLPSGKTDMAALRVTAGS